MATDVRMSRPERSVTPERVRELAMEAWRKFSAGHAWNTQDCTIHIEQAILQAIAEQREADARICEELPDGLNMLGGIAIACAQAIRSGEAAERG